MLNKQFMFKGLKPGLFRAHVYVLFRGAGKVYKIHLRHDLRTPLQCKVFLSGLTTIQASGLETWNPLKTNSEKKIER